MAIGGEELFLEGPSVLIDSISVEFPDIGHEDARDLVRPEKEDGILQDGHQGGHKGRLDCGPGVL